MHDTRGAGAEGKVSARRAAPPCLSPYRLVRQAGESATGPGAPTKSPGPARSWSYPRTPIPYTIRVVGTGSPW